MIKIIVTGANGQLGSELKILARNLQDFLFLFNDIDTLDLTSYKDVDVYIRNHKPDYLINCAAYNAVDKAEQEKEKAFLLNSIVPAKLAEICQKVSCKLIHFSTNYIFDGKKTLPYVETDNPNPLSVYGKSKVQGENEVLKYKNSKIIRTSWLYSEFGNNFVKTILRLAKEKDELNIISDQIGTPTYAADLAKAILHILIKTKMGPTSFNEGIYHFSNEGSCSWFDFASEIAKLAKIPVKINAVRSDQYPLPAERPKYSVLSKSKIKEVYKIDIPDWKESLAKLMNRINNN